MARAARTGIQIIAGGRDMTHDEDAELDEMFPLPAGVVLRECRFGSSNVSPVVALPLPGEQAGTGPERAAVMLRHSDPKLGVTVEVREIRESGHLSARATCTDAGLLNKAEVAVVFFGSAENRLVNRKVPLDVPEENGCSGSADFGKLSALADELGTSLGMVVCLTV